MFILKNDTGIFYCINVTMKYFNFHTHKFTNQAETIELVNQYPRELDFKIPFYSIGIHPWYIETERVSEDLKIIEKALKDEKCLALGECGLDKRKETPLDVQIKVFEKQLHLAEKFQKPVVIHCVAAFQEVVALKEKLKMSVPMIIHGFSKNEQVAQMLLNKGFYLSFGKRLFQESEVVSVFEKIPNDHFFLETDTLDISIVEVYQKAAQIKNVDEDAIIEMVNQNFEKVFKQ